MRLSLTIPVLILSVFICVHKMNCTCTREGAPGYLYPDFDWFYVEKINYTIIRRPKRKTASIVIRPDNRVEVLAPSRMPTDIIATFVQDKSAWIHKKLHFNQEIRAAFIPKTFHQDEPFSLLGKSYSLCLQQGKRAIVLDGHELLVSHPAPTPATTERQINRWYRQQAEMHFKDRCHFFASMLGRHPQSVGIKSYKSRWGSCHHDGRVYFNWRLMMAPEWVIDYVVVHELCHLVHPNHSKQFWILAESTFPVCQEAKKWLKINGLTLAL